MTTKQRLKLRLGESHYIREPLSGGGFVESVQRHHDFMAWVNGDRKMWSADRDSRHRAIEKAIEIARTKG